MLTRRTHPQVNQGADKSAGPRPTRDPARDSWSRQRESNPQPTVYKTVALPLSHAGVSVHDSGSRGRREGRTSRRVWEMAGFPVTAGCMSRNRRGSLLRRRARPGIGGVLPVRGASAREGRRFRDKYPVRRGKAAVFETRFSFWRRTSPIPGRARLPASPPARNQRVFAARQNVSAQKALSGRNSEFWGKGFMQPSRWARKIAYFSPCLADFARFLMVLGKKFYGVGASISNLLPKTR